ncbi:Argonaute/Dicer protein, PAZ [Artemisia annua]|uniref:Argonaute/Dicer protein, PAZ n=1 Tax=Artemisia annua TaxID=35608 RepID=A0A2U1PZM5_ARTAN|nr:Argonaute/Dicer protein, PAZ [Artemisia annua]
MPPSHGMGRGQGAQPVAASTRVPTDGMRNLSTGTSTQGPTVPVQRQTPMQYRPAQSMPPSHGMGRGRGAQPVAASSRVPTDGMRNLSIGTSTPVASVPVQPQPPMQQIAKTTTTQTEAVSLPLVPSSTKHIKPPARPGFGTVGRKIMVTANHFLVQLGDKNPHQYDVTITPEVTSKAKCKDIMKCLIDQYQATHLGNRGLAYDGNKSAFSAGPLPFDNKEFVIVVPEKDGRQREFKVAVKFAATKDIDHLRQFLSGRQHDNPQETIQALDIVLREAASHERIIVGRSIFSTAFEMGPLGDGVDYCRGFYQSLRPTQMGLSLNIGVAFYRAMLVSDFVMEYLGKRAPGPLTEQDRIKVKKALRNIKVEVVNGGFKRTYKVQNVTREATRELTFIDSNGTTVSIVQYYREKYNTTLRHSYLPALNAGTDAKPVYLPMEICRINDGQRYPKKLNAWQIRGMLDATCKRPQLKYHGSGPQSEVSPFVGTWNMKNLKMFNGGTVNYWAVVNFSRQKPQAVDQFVNGIISMCRARGMVFDPQLIPTQSPNSHNIEKALINVDRQCSTELEQRAPGKSLQLLIVILPDMTGSYGLVKRILETDLGIVSQCCQPKHVMKSNPQYFENLAMKINVKVGGTNAILARPIPILNERPTIIFGADVTHPQPGEDSSSSIAAVVASMDRHATKYRALMSAQPHRQEIIEDLDSMIIDGVSEGQFNDVLLHETDQIRKACASLEQNYQPRVTFIVVQKRHHTRLFPMNHNDRSNTDKSGNILPGTVVDTKICHPAEFDFYLCSHAGIKGTSRPTHYHVLYDENKFTADGLQTLTNNLCYTYARCTRSVSIVPAAYYAHLTAFRARYYTEGMGSESESGGRTTRERTAEVRQLPAIRDNVKDVMFYC